MSAGDAFSLDETRRVARLARIALSHDEEARLARDLHAIATDFGQLTAYAASLPEAPPAEAGALRADALVAATAEEADAILRAAPRVEASRLVRVPRGGPL